MLVTLGGSSTFCAECPVGQSWPERVEALLNERYGSNTVCVVNRGMLGMRPDEVADLFHGDIVKRPVDLVLVCSAFNAVEPPLVIDMRPGHTPWITRRLWGRSLLYTTLYNHRMARRQTRWNDEVKTRYRADLRRLVDDARQHSISLVFVLQPLLNANRREITEDVGYIPAALARRQLQDMGAAAPMHAELLTIMQEVAREAGIPVCDPRDAVLRDRDAADNFVLCLHLTPQGADRMAHAIVNELEPMVFSVGAISTCGRRGSRPSKPETGRF